MERASTCAAFKQARPGTELVAGEQVGHLEEGDGRIALIRLCTLGPTDAWLLLGRRLFTNLATNRPELSLMNCRRIFATLVRNHDFPSLSSTSSSTYTRAFVGEVLCI